MLRGGKERWGGVEEVLRFCKRGFCGSRERRSDGQWQGEHILRLL